MVVLNRIVAAYWRLRNSLPGSYEPERERLGHFVRPEDWVVDVGVNMGQYASRLLRLVGKKGKVFGFEAATETFQIARCILRNPAMELRKEALGDVTGTVLLGLYGGESGMIEHGLSRIVSAPDPKMMRTESVPCLRLDDVLAQRPRTISFIKCDVEGFEVHVLRGGQRLIENDRPVLLVEISTSGNYCEIMTLLMPLGYVPYQLTAERTWREVARYEESWTNNFLLVPDSKSRLLC